MAIPSSTTSFKLTGIKRTTTTNQIVHTEPSVKNDVKTITHFSTKFDEVKRKLAKS